MTDSSGKRAKIAKIATAALLLMEEEDDDNTLVELLEVHRRRKVHNIFLKRQSEGCFSTLITNHLTVDDTMFREYFRLTKGQFHEVLNLIADDLKENPTTFVKRPITAVEKLSLVLRYLATGESFRSMAFQYRISHNYISVIVRDVLIALCKHMVPVYLRQPTKEDFLKVAEQFWEKWNFPNCCGAIDGKHVRIVCPSNSGSLFFNYKSYFSIVLLAIVDAQCKFLCINVGAYGKEGDSNIFTKSLLSKLINSNDLMPEDKPLPSTDTPVPFIIVGDEAFKLSTHMLRPYPREQANSDRMKAVFNYRLCRARRTTENAFALLCQTFRIFHTPIAVEPSTVDLIITASCCLHNMIRTATAQFTDDADTISMPTENLISLRASGGNASLKAFQIRDIFKDFFNSPRGSVPWQERRIAETDNAETFTHD